MHRPMNGYQFSMHDALRAG